MAEYQAPVRGGARCDVCGALVAAYRRMPVDGGVRVRYHRCEACGWKGKSVEKVVDSGPRPGGQELTVDSPAANVPHEERKTG